MNQKLLVSLGAFSLMTGIFFGFQNAGDGPSGRIYKITDYEVFGCASNLSNGVISNVNIQVFAEGLGDKSRSNALSSNDTDNECSWFPGFKGHGFAIQYKHPIEDLSKVQVFVPNGNGQPGGIWLDRPELRYDQLKRAKNGVYFENRNYKVNINTEFGAAITEFYNMRKDPNQNLINPDPGAEFQIAMAGDSVLSNVNSTNENMAFDGNKNCMDIKNDGSVWAGVDVGRYNPTQSASACWFPDDSAVTIKSGYTGSNVSNCRSSDLNGGDSNGANPLCSMPLIQDLAPIDDSRPKWVEWQVHLRNFFYPKLTQDSAGLPKVYPYQSYDDVVAVVRYTFHWHYLQADYHIAKAKTGRTYGQWRQQVPVIFLIGVDRLTDSTKSIVRPTDPSDPNYKKSFGHSLSVKPDTERWVQADHFDGNDQLKSSLTFGFYSGLVASKSRICARDIVSTIKTSDVSKRQLSAVQNNITMEFQPGLSNAVLGRTLVFPYAASETLDGVQATPKTAIHDLQPDWDCTRVGPSQEVPSVPQ